ncbi:MAG: hypothetical protein KDC35_14085 [Acidobacteria bacterium]|nr:hypothetical protein [Acidobacteriota bacterium]
MKLFVSMVFLGFALMSAKAERSLVFPWVTHTELFRSRLVINNLSAQPADVTLEAFRAPEEQPNRASASLMLGPLEQRIVDPETLFPELGLGRGFCVYLSSNSDRIAGQVIIEGTGSPSGNSPAQSDVVPLSQASNTLQFNYLTSGDDYLPSAPVIINPNEETFEVTFEAYQGGHLVASTTRMIEAWRPYAMTTTDLFLNQLDGPLFMVATAQRPLIGVAFLFNEWREPALANATALSYLPGDDLQTAMVETLIPTGIAADGFMVNDQGLIITAGGWRTDHVQAIDPNGSITTLGTGFSGPVHVTQAEDGTYYISSFNDGTIKTLSPTGEIAVFAQGLDAPVGMDFDENGDLIVCIYGYSAPGHTLVRITPSGDVLPFIDDALLYTPIDVISAGNGIFYVANQVTARIMTATSTGEVHLVGQLPTNLGHMVFFEDSFYATGGNAIYRMDLGGNVFVFSGGSSPGSQDGPVDQATFTKPNGIAVGPDRTLYVISATQGAATSSLRAIRLH